MTKVLYYIHIYVMCIQLKHSALPGVPFCRFTVEILQRSRRERGVRNWFIYFKELALVIVGASKYEISRTYGQIGISIMNWCCSLESEICSLEIQTRFLCCSFGTELLLLWGNLFFLKAFSWLDEQPLLTPIMEGNLLYSEAYRFRY